MTKYRIVQQDDDVNIIVEDGGIASFHNSSGKYFLIEYYGDRITSEMNSDNIWDKLSEGKMWCNEFPLDTPKIIMIQDALDWLVVGENKFVEDNTLFLNIFP